MGKKNTKLMDVARTQRGRGSQKKRMFEKHKKVLCTN
jgi:hypothetical protein